MESLHCHMGFYIIWQKKFKEWNGQLESERKHVATALNLIQFSSKLQTIGTLPTPLEMLPTPWNVPPTPL